MEVKTQIQQSRQYAQAFGRGVYDDILRWGDSEMLTLLCRSKKCNAEESYMDCLHRFYSSMKRHYRCEYVFKNEIIAELRKQYAHRQSLIVNEFRVGNSIADLAFFNGEGREDGEFPIAGPSFNKYFRNPDFCNEDKWTEAAKVLKAVRKDYMEGE